MLVQCWADRNVRLTSAAVVLVLAVAAPQTVRADDVATEELTAAELALVKSAEAHRVRAIQRVYGAVVAIYGNDRQGGGSGVLYDESGLALTNHHVVAAAGSEGWAGLADGKLYRWKLIGTDPGGDVAMIQLTGRDKFPVAPLGDSETVHVGDWAMAMGNPFVLAEDQKPTVTLGIVSGVKRYQGGAGLNTLVYGNCIQVDSSINPGNSGGPLFNMRGEIIGINGRGSFEERGRVNVGLGYAISSDQVKHFLPDLLATKIAQHGTLDAVFGERDGKVVCESINLDAPAAELGLELGDRLLAFEGLPIRSANQFTNIIATLPADWPAEVVFEHDGQQKTIWVRLYPLPYQLDAPEEAPQPQPQKDVPTPDEPEKKKPGEKQPDQPQQPSKQTPPPKQIPQPRPPGPKVAITSVGTVRDLDLNQANCRRLLARWRDFAGTGPANGPLRVFRIADSIYRGDEKIGWQTLLLASDGRFRVEYSTGVVTRLYGFDGQTYWGDEGLGHVDTLKPSTALLNPHVAQAVALSAVFHSDPLSTLGKVTLDGGDKSQRQIAYRVKTVDAAGDWFYVWLSVLGEHGRPEVRLLKASADLDSGGFGGAVTFADWQMVAGVRLPFRRELVRGLSEQTVLRMVAENCELLSEVADVEFRSPAHAAPPSQP